MKISILFLVATTFLAQPLWAIAPEVTQTPPAQEQVPPSPKVQIPTVLNSPQPEDIEKVLDEQGAQLDQIEDLIKAKQYGKAKELAKHALDEIKIKTGVDPEVTVEQPIVVKGVLTADEIGLQLKDLPYNTQNLIKEAVRNYQGGLYLDLVNLAKRTYVHWVAAEYMRYVNSGHFFNEDRVKIDKDLARARAYAIFIQDTNVPQGPLMIADTDVVDQDQVYDFDREILTLGTSLPDLKLDEATFKKMVADDWQQRLDDHLRAIKAADQAQSQGDDSSSRPDNYLTHSDDCVSGYTPGELVTNGSGYEAMQCLLTSKLGDSYGTADQQSCASGYIDGEIFDDSFGFQSKNCLKIGTRK